VFIGQRQEVFTVLGKILRAGVVAACQHCTKPFLFRRRVRANLAPTMGTAASARRAFGLCGACGRVSSKQLTVETARRDRSLARPKRKANHRFPFWNFAPLLSRKSVLAHFAQPRYCSFSRQIDQSSPAWRRFSEIYLSGLGRNRGAFNASGNHQQTVSASALSNVHAAAGSHPQLLDFLVVIFPIKNVPLL